MKILFTLTFRSKLKRENGEIMPFPRFILQFIVCTLFFLVFLNSSEAKASIRQKLLLLNVNECSKCVAYTIIINEKLHNDNEYKILVYGIKSKKIDYYLESILHLENSKGRGFAKDSMFLKLSPDLSSKMIVIEDSRIIFFKDISKVNINNINEFTFDLYSEKITLKENLAPLNAKNIIATNISNNRFAVLDKDFNKVFIYAKDGNQIKSIVIDSILLKEIYYKYFNSNDNWEEVKGIYKKSNKYVKSIPSKFNYISPEKNFTIFVTISLPKKDSFPAEAGKIIWQTYSRSFLIECDTLGNIKKYIPLSSVEIDNYYINGDNGFILQQDSLYLPVFNYEEKDTISYLLAKFYNSNTEFEFEKLSLRLDRTHFKEIFDTKGHLFVNSNDQILYIFNNFPYFIDVNKKNVRKFQHIDTSHIFRSYFLVRDSIFNYFIYSADDKVYLTSFDQDFRLIKSWNLLNIKKG